ncbi:MAG: PAS domain S-box protein, partial [Candidatus Thorarchaeota archaeon]
MERSEFQGPRGEWSDFMEEIAPLLNDQALTHWELMREIVKAIPSHLSRPGSGWARLVLRGKELKSDNYAESARKERKSVIIEGKTVGFVEVGYPEDCVGPDEEAFTEADKRLIERVVVHVAWFTKYNASKEAEKRKSSILKKMKGFSKMGSLEWNLNDNKVAYSDEIIDILGLGSRKFDVFGDFEQIIHPDDRKGISEHVRHLVEEKIPIDTEFRVMGTEGDVKWIHALCEAVCDEEGEAVKITCVIENVTERKQAEQDLRESEEKYRAVFEEARDGIVLMNYETGQIIECNPEFERQTGRELETLTKMRIWEIRPPEKRKAARSKFHEVQRIGAGGSSELDFQRPDGRIIPIEFNAKVIRLQDAPIIQAITRDISNRRLVEEAIIHQSDFESLISRISTGFIELDLDGIDGEIERSLESIANFAGADQGMVIQFENDGKGMSVTHEWSAERVTPNADTMKELLVKDLPWISERIRELEPIGIGDIDDLPQEAGAFKEELKRGGIKSIMLVPMILGDQQIGVLGFDSKNGRAWSKDVISMLGLASNVFANAISRKDKDALQQERLRWFHSLIENSSDIILVMDSEGGIQYVSPAVKTLLGYKPEEVIGRTVVDFIHPEDAEKAMENFSKALSSPGPVDPIEARVRNSEGSWRHFEGVTKILLMIQGLRVWYSTHGT